MGISHSGAVAPPYDFILISAGVPASDIDLPNGTRGLLVGTAGNLNVTMENGQERNAVPFVQGINPGFFVTVRSGGTASDIWAIM